IYQIRNVDGMYINTWTSDPISADGIDGISVGDADNDGMPDITAVVKFAGRGKKFIKIYMYNSGSQGIPDYIGSDLSKSFSFIRDSIIADADNDGKNELIIAGDNHISIFRWNGSDFINIWNSRNYPDLIFSVDVGDTDNDGLNEIVLAPFSIGSPVILESLGNDIWGNEQMTEPVSEEDYGPGFTWLAIDYAKVRDADNIPGNEVVAGGNNNRLMIWKYNNETEEYNLDFISEDLGGFTQGADAGDIDGDSLNEVITLAIFNDNIYRFDFDGSSYQYDSIYQIPISYLALGNIDDDSKDEIVVYSFALSILEDNGAGLNLAYEFPYTGNFEIWEDEIQIEPDTIPPAGIIDLSATNSTAFSIDLAWTAPGDDGIEGTASQYDIRYSTSRITDTNWNDATECESEPSPAPAYSGESFTVTGLTPNTPYYFALKTADEAQNWSFLSNIWSGTTDEATTQSMHVFAIDMSLKTAGPIVNASAVITIVDNFGNPVSGATVSGNWSGATSETASGVTDLNGQVEIKSARLKNPNPGTPFTFTVVNIEKNGWTYDSSANLETSDSITYY
ncbi:FG-GAP-like repeat-containing protein, partial [Acidobacteriota bacterium]